MSDFYTTIAGLPGLKELAPPVREGLAERVVAQILAAHRWPFLLQVQDPRTWAANDSVQSLMGIFRVWSVMYPDTDGLYYRLQELSDIEFQRAIENFPNETRVKWWRDAGTNGNDLLIELYPVPTSAVTLKIDYTIMPAYSDIDALPHRFQGLVIDGMMAMLGNYGAKVSFKAGLEDAIAREQDLQGKRDRIGRDIVQSNRWARVNRP